MSFTSLPTSTTSPIPAPPTNKTPTSLGRSRSAKEVRNITVTTSALGTTPARPSSARKPVKYGPISPRVASPNDSNQLKGSPTEKENSAPEVPPQPKTQPQTYPHNSKSYASTDSRQNSTIATEKSQESITSGIPHDQDTTQRVHNLASAPRHGSVSQESTTVNHSKANTTKQLNHPGVTILKTLVNGSSSMTSTRSNSSHSLLNKTGLSPLNIVNNKCATDTDSTNSNGSSGTVNNESTSKNMLGFLGLKSPLLATKKRGSDTSIKDNTSLPSSPSLATTPSLRDGPLSSSSLKDSLSVNTPSSPKRGFLSPASFSPSKILMNESHQRGSTGGNNHSHQNTSRQEQKDPLLNGQHQPFSRNTASTYQPTEREMLPPHHYENEDFALWIRTVAQARQVVSGEDVEDEGDTPASSTSSTHSSTNPNAKPEKKKPSPELEDMAILEEILDFALIILMRASASLYPYIYAAHSKMIKVYVPWQRLHPKDRPCEPVRNARDFQNVVMRDIGEAIDIMTEIYEQEVRPFGHPDNQGRDIKQHFGPQYGTFVRPPPNSRRASNAKGSSAYPNTANSGESKKGTMAQLLNTIGITANNGSSSSNNNKGDGNGGQHQKSVSPTTLRTMAAELSNSGFLSNPTTLSTSAPHQSQPHQRPTPIQTTPSPAPVVHGQQNLQSQNSFVLNQKSPHQQHRRRSSVNYVKTSMASIGKNIMKSMPSPNILNSAPIVQLNHRGSQESYSSPMYAFADDASSVSSTASTQSVPVPVPSRQSQPLSLHSALESRASFSSTSTHQSQTTQQFSSNMSFPSSIQSIFGFKSPLNSSSQNSHHGYMSSGSEAVAGFFSPQSSTGIATPSRQEERQQRLEANWRADIVHRKAALRAWCCHRFTDLYEFSLNTTCSLESEFKDLYRIINAIVEVNRTDRSHETLAWELERTKSNEQPFKLRYSQYRSVAPTSDEIDAANKTSDMECAAEYACLENSDDATVENETVSRPDVDMQINMIPPTPLMHRPGSAFCSTATAITTTNMALTLDGSDQQQQQQHDPENQYHLSDERASSAYENMEFYRLQEHPLWEPLLDRITKFDSTHHSLDPRNIFQFLRRMSVDEEPMQRLSDATRKEMLAVLWVIERCVCERPDAQQSPTWFRLSSSASAVQAVFKAGGVLPYLKNLRAQHNDKDPILTVHPVTLTGYFKRLLKDAGGLLLKETTGLFVELVRPTTDNGDFWNLEQLSRIDRALLLRVICLDRNRGEVFMRISRVMAMILERAPEDMELDAFALSKMVQVVELSGVLDLKALKRWNGAWSAIILGYM
ncbi:hypothetical protein BGZ94_000519 [Podila epigama]|nr:hypothetical protein BGZ94_000519 [Podila epigama]